jgi:hypothetical protein
MQKAGFDNVLQRNSYFTAWKLRLISIRYLLGKNRSLHPEMRSDLIQKILFEGNFWHAQQILTKLEDKNVGTRGIGSRFHGPIASEDTLKREMKRLAANVSDSQFLLDIKMIEDKDKEMRTVIEQVESLVYEQLGYSIDKAVEAMTRVVLDMQKKRCRKSMQQKIESEEKRLLKGALAEFIGDINALSVGRRDSCVFSPSRHSKILRLTAYPVVLYTSSALRWPGASSMPGTAKVYMIWPDFIILDNLTSEFRVFDHRPPESDQSTQAEASSSPYELNER